MKFKHYREWKIPEAATKAAPGKFSGVYFYMEGNGISAAGRITITMSYVNLMRGILRNACKAV